MAMLLLLLLNNKCFRCPGKAQLLILERNRHHGLKLSVGCFSVSCDKMTTVALRKPATTHGHVCSSHQSRLACTSTAAQPSLQRMPGISFLQSSHTEHLTFHYLHSTRLYIFTHTKPVFLSSSPPRGRHHSVTTTPPREDGCWLTLKFLGSTLSWVACFWPSGFSIPRKASVLSRCCTMSLMAVKTLLPWPLT